MAYLNQFLSTQDLAALSENERQFLVERIDHVLDNHPDVREKVADGLKEALGAIRKDKLGIRRDQVKAASY